MLKLEHPLFLTSPPFKRRFSVKRSIFTGSGVAIITPFKHETVDLNTLARLLDFHLDNGTRAIIVCGTTGEAATMTYRERMRTIEFCSEYISGRIPVIAGSGSNSTEIAIALSKDAERAGADGLLVVTPYYNKTNQQGLIRHYQVIADAVNSPVILYNVPSRTGVNIEPSTYKALADHENIIAIKEANGNISKIVETMSYVNGKLDLYSGNDDQIVPLMSLGGKGVISVVSNILPRKTSELCAKFLSGDIKGAADIQYNLHAVIDSLFSEVNPIPVKAAMAKMGFGTNTLRLPLTPMNEAKYEVMLNLMREQGLDV
jgi:4-hydroxy-tetrahydrodipicolinate synthase